MGDILSQNEIDELLKALNTGELDLQEIQTTAQEKKVKVHDFSKPSKFAKEHIKTLYNIHEIYARLVTTFLTGYLRTPVQVEVIEVQALPYNEFSNSISNPAVLGVIDFSPLNGSIIMDMSPVVAYALIDRILGGKGLAMERIRGFTEIELAIVERVIIQILSLLREPWESVIDIRPRLEKIETNAQFAQIVSPTETVSLITLGAKIGDAEGFINICVPYIVLEPVIGKLSTKMWYSTEKKEITPETKLALEKRIQNTLVPVRAVLGATEISVQEFLELQIGDVIPLDTNVNGDLNVMVGDLLKFKGKPGVKKNKVAIKIAEVVRREDD